MRFDEKKKNAIRTYILEKLENGDKYPINSVCEAFNITQNTFFTYLRQLQQENLIRRSKRGEYEPVTAVSQYEFSRSSGQLREEQVIYDTALSRHFTSLPANVREVWSYILAEMINNVIDHSEAELLRITVCQDFLNTSVIIEDNGIGIFKKLRDYFHLHSAEDVICELFKGKLTTDPARHSGEGIFFSSRLADRFAILSDGKLFSCNRFDAAESVEVSGFMTGTIVLVALSNRSNKRSKEVFDQYAEVGGAFTKTEIPLKNVFDAAPVSRSQARRVCARLDAFSEVVLDFEGLEWMGQGFAHQIFVVFQNEQPDIKIIPENMCEAVARMYTHVTGRKAGDSESPVNGS